MKPTADEFNISASMEPVTPFDATAHTNSEWPDEQQSEWDGEDGPYNGLVSGAEWVDGLPTVGSKVKMSCGKQFFEATIEAYSIAKDAVMWDCNGVIDCASIDHCVFRPIRTAEQQAADDRESSIKQIMSDMNYSGSDYSAAARLYDAGYRLTDKG